MAQSKLTSLYALLITAMVLPLTGCAEAMQTEQNGNDNSETESAEWLGDSFYFPLPETQGDPIESEELTFYVQTVAEDLGVPWGMAFLPDGHVLISQRNGTLHLIRDGEVLDTPVANVPEVWARGQGGLLDMTLHPDYEENGWIYMSYSKPGDGGANTAVIRTRLNPDAPALEDIEELYVGTPFSGRGQHFGGRIAFDPEGYLYFSIGDRGEMETAQDLTKSNGSVIRLNDDGSIPEDNPFVGREGLDEIYTYGLRNIQGMDVHPETGKIWTNEHGPRGGDEINVHSAGANYGWPEITYGINYNGTIITEETEREGMEQPVTYWDPSIAPSGLTFVTSDRYPGWQGDILNGALAFQLISRVEVDGTDFQSEERILEGIGRIRDIEEAPDGYIYFTNESNGTLSRIIPIQD
ncbi:PQQ-dependent sugar dehydrogenase [Rhodohalobacter mucosus]|nr:PQQ-dependent sugar dehydrogenase [Rhodohalobacter mucosus]